MFEIYILLIIFIATVTVIYKKYYQSKIPKLFAVISRAVSLGGENVAKLAQLATRKFETSLFT